VQCVRTVRRSIVVFGQAAGLVLGIYIATILRQLGGRDVAVNNLEVTFSVVVPIESATQIPANLQIVPARWDRQLSIFRTSSHYRLTSGSECPFVAERHLYWPRRANV